MSIKRVLGNAGLILDDGPRTNPELALLVYRPLAPKCFLYKFNF